MNKYIISILVIASAMTLSTVSAESGATVTSTTATGTATGTTTTGTTATGTTATGVITGTGVKCTTASGMTRMDNQEAIMAAQQAFSVEIARLVNVKQAAYSGAQTLTGTARFDAMKSANTEFRTGFKAAQKTLSLAKKDRKSNHQEIKECKKDRHEDKKEEKKAHREEVKSEVKDLKDRIKALRAKRDAASGQSTGRR